VEIRSALRDRRELPQGVYRVILVVAALLWGSSYVTLKDVYEVLSPSWLLGIRFVLAGALTSLVLHRRLARNLDRGHVIAAVLMGLTGGIGYLVQNIGLVDTTPGHNAFLTATYCVMVPFLHWAAAKVQPTIRNIAAAVLAVAGVGMLSLGGEDPFSLRWGDWLTLTGAFWFAIQIEVMVAVTRGRDVLAITCIEFFVMGLVNLAYGIVAEPAPSLETLSQPHLWVQIMYLVVFSGCLCTMMQNVGQAHVPPSQASLLLSLESVSGVLFSVFFYGEVLTPALVGGFALVFAGVLLSEL